MDDINIQFSKALKNLRVSKGLTQEKLSELSGIDYKYLQKLESATPSSPTLSTLHKLATGLNVSLLELVEQVTTLNK